MAGRRTAQRHGGAGGSRGAILGIVMFLALIASVISYGLLGVAVSQARQAVVYRDRTPARYLAEAGSVWAQQRLFGDPTWSGGTLTVSGVDVDVTVTPSCPAAPCPPRTIQSRVAYPQAGAP